MTFLPQIYPNCGCGILFFDCIIGFLVLLLHLLIYFPCTLSHYPSVGSNDRRGSVDKKDGVFFIDEM